MASKDDNEGCGCLAIAGLIGGYFLIKNIIWPWFDANKEAIGTWVIGLLSFGTLGTLFYIVMRSVVRKQRFLSKYGKWFNAKDQITQESKKILREVSNELTELECEVQRLLRDSMSC